MTDIGYRHFAIPKWLQVDQRTPGYQVWAMPCDLWVGRKGRDAVSTRR